MARFFILLFVFVVFTLFHSFAQNDTTFIIGGVQFKMIFVKGGTFRMGIKSDTLLKSISPDYKSQYNMEHYVSLSDYYMMETEVTQELWEKMMHYNRSFHKGKLLPVENVSWKECEIFCKRLSRKTGLLFRLPTASEWEYAANGGLNKDGCLFSGDDIIDSVAWYIGNSHVESHCVKSLKSNHLVYMICQGMLENGVSTGFVGHWILLRKQIQQVQT